MVVRGNYQALEFNDGIDVDRSLEELLCIKINTVSGVLYVGAFYHQPKTIREVYASGFIGHNEALRTCEKLLIGDFNESEIVPRTGLTPLVSAQTFQCCVRTSLGILCQFHSNYLQIMWKKIKFYQQIFILFF